MHLYNDLYAVDVKMEAEDPDAGADHDQVLRMITHRFLFVIANTD